MKSEPDAFSIDDLRKAGTAVWDGVRNFEARNHLRAMRRGDLAFFYHSNAAAPSIVGLMEVVGEARPDPTQFDPAGSGFDPKSRREEPRWSAVEVRFVERFARPLGLSEIRGTAPLRGMVLLARGRLSVQPVSASEGRWILVRCRPPTRR